MKNNEFMQNIMYLANFLNLLILVRNKIDLVKFCFEVILIILLYLNIIEINRENINYCKKKRDSSIFLFLKS